MNAAFRDKIRICVITASFTTSVFRLATPIQANALSVEVLQCNDSSQRARITLDLKGIGAKKATLIVKSDGQVIQPLSIGESGIAVLPPLAPGRYVVEARAPNNLGRSICLDISKSKRRQGSSFDMFLTPLPPAPLSAEQMLAAAESDAPSEHLQEFRGVLVDPSGAGIAGSVIQIYPKGARLRSDAPSAKVVTGAGGRFVKPLADGNYAAVVMTPGFRPKIIIFEITHLGSAQDLRISLEIGEISE
jgi:hypothetical protein